MQETPIEDKIVTVTAVLLTRSRETTAKEIEELKLVDRLATMFDKGWCQSLGWAAIQIGIPLRCAVYRPGIGQVVLLNPVVKDFGGLHLKSREGCMSLPYERHNTHRYKWITIENGPENGRYVIQATGVEAHVIQHEIDHMDGILCYERTRIQERNEKCACGSGVKFKKCHGR